MKSRTVRYVWLIALCALVGALAVLIISPNYRAEQGEAALVFSALGLLTLLLSHQIRQGTTGSIASIPYLGCAVVAPSWIAVLAVTLSALAVVRMRRLEGVKVAFNTAQYSLAVSCAILAYRLFGGRSLLDDPTFQLVPYSALVLTFFAVNTLSVSGVIAIDEGKQLSQVWRRITSGALAYDLLASPVPYFFGWVYVTHGAVWTGGLALPLLAIRQAFKTNWQLEQINQDLLQLMVAAIEARDPYTSGHSRRVAHYAKIIARAMGMGARAVERVGIAALLHDVGKIHEQYAPILRKPDKLTLEERLVIQTHPLKSAELVSNVSQLRDLVAPIRHHHENWDGTGYPDGLVGDEIPLTARIIMIADTIDAMTSDRPYRQALGEEEVRHELNTLSGRQFDPTITRVLLSSPLYKQLFFAGGRITPRYTPVFTPTPLRRVSSQ